MAACHAFHYTSWPDIRSSNPVAYVRCGSVQWVSQQGVLYGVHYKCTASWPRNRPAPLMPVRAITFDFWMTLFQEQHRKERHHYRVDAFCRATGAPWDEASAALQSAHDYFFYIHDREQRTLMPRDAVDMVCDALSITMDPEEADAMAEIFGTAIHVFPPTPVPGALEAVSAAAARVPIGIISDSGMSPGTSLRKLLDDHGFTPHFSALTFSDEVGVAKPQASLADGLLDIVATDDITRWDILKELPRLQRGTHIQHPKVKSLRAQQVEVTSETPLAVDVDGELAGYTPVRLTVLPAAVRFFVASDLAGEC